MVKRIRRFFGSVTKQTIAVFFIMLCISALFIFYVEKNRQEREYEQMKYIAQTVISETYETMSEYLSKTRILEAFIVQNNGEIRDFGKIASMITSDGPIRNVLFAPNGVVSYVYPVEGNESLLGYDLKGEGAGNKEAVAAIESGEMIMAGPFRLVQGGLGIAGRLPVFLNDSNGVKKFWGIVSVTLDYPKVLDNDVFDDIFEQGFLCELWRINADTGEIQVIKRTNGTPLHMDHVFNETYRIYNSEWYVSVSPAKLWYQNFSFWMYAALGILVSFLIALAEENYSSMRVIKNEFQLAAMQWSKITFIYDFATGAFTFLNFGDQNKSMPDPGERYDTAMWHSIMHPNDVIKDIKLREEIISGLSRSEADLRIKIDGGKDYRWYHFIAETIRDPSGKPQKILGTLSDIEATYNQISELRRQIEHDQTEVLLTQISSHFFYHTLNAIQALIVLEPERASKMINDFSRYLRYRIDSVAAEKGLVTLKEEMRSVTAYADINVVQLGERLKVQYEIETEDFEIPVLTVQPIVENAIIHGIKPKAEGGTVRIRASEKADCYQVTVEDDGVGFIPDEAKKHTSVGMHNILTRLGRYKDCSMTIVSEKGSGTSVTLSFPKTMEVMG